MKNDVQIQQDVVAELDREPNVVNGTIGVEVHHGVVKLAGKVDDSGIRQNAKVAASAVDGVSTVVMDVDVASTAAGSIPQSTGDITRGPRIA
jgi:osmotically-inducible protein OsmY